MSDHIFTPEEIAVKIAASLKKQQLDEENPQERAGKASIVLNALYKPELRKMLFDEIANIKSGKESSCIMQEFPLLESFARWMSWTGEGMYQYFYYSECLKRFNDFAENLNLHLCGMADILSILDQKFWEEFYEEVNDKTRKVKNDIEEMSENPDEHIIRHKPYLLFDEVYEIRINSIGNMEVSVRVDALGSLVKIDSKSISVSFASGGYRPMQLKIKLSDCARNKDHVYDTETIKSINDRFKEYIKLFGHGKTNRI